MRVYTLAFSLFSITATALQVPLFLNQQNGPLGTRLLGTPPASQPESGRHGPPPGSDNEPGFPLPDPHAVPLVPFQNLEHFTAIALGTPAQTFRALIDISWSGVLVPSVICKNQRFGVCNGHFMYHATWSRTHVATEREVHNQILAGLRYDAAVTQDTLSIAGIEIPGQEVLEATSVETHPLAFHADSVDAVLGLAPDSSTSPAGTTGPLTNMLKRGLLERNIVSVMLGRWVRRSNMREGELLGGELMLGGINEELLMPNTTMTFLSMSNKTDPPEATSLPFCNNTWQIPAGAVSMTWFNETLGAKQTERVEFGESWTARLDTTLTFVTVPARIEAILAKLADPLQVPYFYPFIDCELRPELPDLVFTLGRGDEAEDFVLTAYDYTIEADLLGYGKQCLWTVSRGYGGWDDREVMVLGNPFVRGFYLALDSDMRKVGIGTPRWRQRTRG